MKLKLIAGFLIGFFATAQMISLALRVYYMDKHDFPLAKVAYAARERPNVIFVGASFIDMGINPEVFDAELAKTGTNLRSFNFGVDGLSVVEMSYFLHELLDRMPRSPRYAVLSPCFQCLNIARESNNVRGIDFFNFTNAFAFTRFILSYNALPEPALSRPAYLRNILAALFRHYTNLSTRRSGAWLVNLRSRT